MIESAVYTSDSNLAYYDERIKDYINKEIHSGQVIDYKLEQRSVSINEQSQMVNIKVYTIPKGVTNVILSPTMLTIVNETTEDGQIIQGMTGVFTIAFEEYLRNEHYYIWFKCASGNSMPTFIKPAEIEYAELSIGTSLTASTIYMLEIMNGTMFSRKANAGDQYAIMPWCTFAPPYVAGDGGQRHATVESNHIHMDISWGQGGGRWGLSAGVTITTQYPLRNLIDSGYHYLVIRGLAWGGGNWTMSNNRINISAVLPSGDGRTCWTGLAFGHYNHSIGGVLPSITSFPLNAGFFSDDLTYIISFDMWAADGEVSLDGGYTQVHGQTSYSYNVDIYDMYFSKIPVGTLAAGFTAY